MSDYIVDDNGCWTWQRGRVGPYGLIADKGERRAHRHYWAEAFGPIPDDHDIHHLCGNTLCVNPDHLQALPAREHDIEHFLRERGYSFEAIRQVRADRAAGLSIRQICAKRNMPYSTVRDWCRAATWTDIMGEEPTPLPTTYCVRSDCDNVVVSKRPDKQYCSEICKRREAQDKRNARRRAARKAA